MEPLKGFDNLLRALARLRHSQPQRYAHLRALLVGGEPEAQPHAWNSEQRRLAALRESLGIAKAVTFAGAQPHQCLPDYYAAADVFVMPSHYESFGLAALEAMACAVPVVASRVGGLTYTIEDERSGLLVPPDQPPALAARLERLLTDSALRERLQAGALQRAAASSWGAVAGQLCQLYADVIQK
jgi:D-inositol-3-phosphate glycosyltransferase